MTANATQDARPVAPSPSENGLGIAGFILSLIGLVSCGLLSPLGLVFSFAGMFRRPRGLAIAGLVLGLVGCLWVVIVVVVIGLAAIVSCASVAVPAHFRAQDVMTQAAMTAAVARIEEFRLEHNALPNEDEGQDLIAGSRDAWGRDLRYERYSPEDYDVRSAGGDGRFDTPDDLTPRHPGTPERMSHRIGFD
jgi:hypothetical protein